MDFLSRRCHMDKMKILTIDDMLAAAEDTEMPDHDQQLAALERQATEFAEHLARHLGVGVDPMGATYERFCCGICATFVPKNPDQACPEILEELDPGGDW